MPLSIKKIVNRELISTVSTLPAFEDWGNVTSYSGCRKREWTQDEKFQKFHPDPFRGMQGEWEPGDRPKNKQAFTPGDLSCYDAVDGRPVALHDFLDRMDLVDRISANFSQQKNGVKNNKKEGSTTQPSMLIPQVVAQSRVFTMF